MGRVGGFLTELEEIYRPPPPFFQRILQSLLHYSRQVREGERGQAAALQGVKTSGGGGSHSLFLSLSPHAPTAVQRVRNKIPGLSITWACALCTLNQCLSAESIHNNGSHQSRGYCVSHTPLSTFHVCQLIQASQQPYGHHCDPHFTGGNQGTKEEILYVTHLKLT